MKPLTDQQKNEIFEAAARDIDRYPQPTERRNELKTILFLIVAEPTRGLLNATNKVGYAVRAAINTLKREENEFNQYVSLSEEDEDGRLKFEPIAALDADPAHDREPDLESQLPVYKQEYCDFLRLNGLKGVAKKLGCGVRSAQGKFKKLLQDEDGRSKGKGQSQGDLFGGAL